MAHVATVVTRIDPLVAAVFPLPVLSWPLPNAFGIIANSYSHHLEAQLARLLFIISLATTNPHTDSGANFLLVGAKMAVSTMQAWLCQQLF